MSRKLVSSTTLRPDRAVQVVLIHGLFANSAFWLPDLGRLAAFRVTLVQVDYARMLAQDVPLAEVAAAVQQLIGPSPAHLVCHSFGGWVGSRLPHPFRSRAFICPTFAATLVDGAAFCAAVAARLGTEPATTAPLVARAIGYKASQPQHPAAWPADALYFPEDDPFFRYAAPPGTVAYPYRGGHFNIAEPMDAIMRRLAACG